MLFSVSGGYREALKQREGEPIEFDHDKFIMTRRAAMRPFLQNLLQLQCFEQVTTEIFGFLELLKSETWENIS